MLKQVPVMGKFNHRQKLHLHAVRWAVGTNSIKTNLASPTILGKSSQQPPNAGVLR